MYGVLKVDGYDWCPENGASTSPDDPQPVTLAVDGTYNVRPCYDCTLPHPSPKRPKSKSESFHLQVLEGLLFGFLSRAPPFPSRSILVDSLFLANDMMANELIRTHQTTYYF